MEAPVTSTVMSDLPDEVSALKSQATVARPPTSDRERLLQYLREKANRTSSSGPEMAAIQSEANTQRAMIGALEGANTIFQSSLGNKVDPNAYATAKANVPTPLNDYLARRKAERDAESDKFQAVKEMADLESSASKAGLGKDYTNIEIGSDGKFHKVVKKVDAAGKVVQTVDLGRATEFETGQSNKAQEMDIRQKEAKDRNEYRGVLTDLKKQGLTTKIADEFNKSGVTDAEVLLPKLDNLLIKTPEGENIPGFGRLESSLPGVFATDEGNNNRMLVEALAAPIRKANFGTAQSKGESANFLKQIGSGNVGPETLRLGIKLQKELIDAEKKRIYQSNPEAAAAFIGNESKAGQLMGDKTPPAATPDLSDKERRRQELLNKQKASQPKGG